MMMCFRSTQGLIQVKPILMRIAPRSLSRMVNFKADVRNVVDSWRGLTTPAEYPGSGRWEKWRVDEYYSAPVVWVSNKEENTAKRHISRLFAALLCAGALVPLNARADSHDTYNRKEPNDSGPHHHLTWVHRHFIWVHGHRVLWVPGLPGGGIKWTERTGAGNRGL